MNNNSLLKSTYTAIVTTIIAFLTLVPLTSSSQSLNLHINLNETYPLGNEQMGYYPMLWYSSTEGRGILLGGFGVGLSYIKPRSEKLQVEIETHLQRSRYYDIPIILKDINGSPVGARIGIANNYNATILALAKYKISSKYDTHIGIGLGAKIIAYAHTNYGPTTVLGEEFELNIRNNSLAPVVATIPVEISQKIKKITLTIRAEITLSPTMRIYPRTGERSFITYVDFGYLIKNFDKEKS